MNVEKIDFDLMDLLRETHCMMKPLAQKKNLDFAVHFLSPIPKIIRSDPTRLRQCLYNLCGNAIKFTETGHVYINVSCLEKTDCQIRIDIEDTGIGVAQENHTKIFQAFTQADTSTSRKYGGTGLGLAITNQLIKLLQGKISLRSQPGKGSIFSLLLPAGVNENELVMQNSLDCHPISCNPSPKPIIFQQEKILVVDDNPHNLRLLEIFLKRLNLSITMAVNGQEALDRIAQEKFHLVLMDMQMPVLDGKQTTRILRQKDYTLPVIALTGHNQPEIKAACLQAGCNDFLSKPVDQNQLALAIAKFLPAREKETNSPGTAVSDLSADHKITSRLAGDRDLSRVVDIFLQDLPRLIEKLKHCLELNNLSELSHLAHELKGSGANAGFDIIFEKGRALEEASHQQQLAEVKNIISQIEALEPRLICP